MISAKIISAKISNKFSLKIFCKFSNSSKKCFDMYMHVHILDEI